MSAGDPGDPFASLRAPSGTSAPVAAPAAPARGPGGAAGIWDALTTNPLARGIGGVASNIERQSERFQRTPLGKGLVEATKLPGDALNAVLGAQQRAVAGGLGTALKGDLNPAHVLGMGVYGTFHPNDPRVEQTLENAVHLNSIPGMRSPGWLGNLERFAGTTGVQTLTDPLTYETLGAGAVAEKVLDAYDAAARLALISPEMAVHTTALQLVTNVQEKLNQLESLQNQLGHRPTFQEILKNVPADRQAIDAVNAGRNRGIIEMKDKLMNADDILNRNAAWAKGKTRVDVAQAEAEGSLPPEIADALGEHGFGYQPSLFQGMPSEAALEAANKQKIWQNASAEQALKERLGEIYEDQYKTDVTKYISDNFKHLTPDQIERISYQAQSPGAQFLRQQQQLAALHSQIESLATLPEKTKQSTLTALARAQTAATLAEGLPHGRNVDVAAYMAMGIRGLAEGMGNAIRYGGGAPPEGLKIMNEAGATAHFGSMAADTPIIQGAERYIPGFKQYRRAASGLLGRLDNGLRWADWQRLTRENPDMPAFEKAARVNADIGQYNVRPGITNAAESIGANFPQWHGYVVPTMVARAMLRNPARVEAFVRSQQNWNDQVTGQRGWQWTLGGPIDEAASAYLDPLRLALGEYPTYYGGQSTAGILSMARPSPENLPERIRGFALGLVPFGANIEDVLENAKQFRMNALTTLLPGILGVYPSKRQPGSKRRLGMTQNAAEMQPVPLAAPAAAGAAATPAAGSNPFASLQAGSP